MPGKRIHIMALQHEEQHPALCPSSPDPPEFNSPKGSQGGISNPAEESTSAPTCQRPAYQQPTWTIIDTKGAPHQQAQLPTCTSSNGCFGKSKLPRQQNQSKKTPPPQHQEPSTSPTQNEELRGVPHPHKHQSHHHHLHHHHHYHHQWAPVVSCCCLCSSALASSSPSLQQTNAEQWSPHTLEHPLCINKTTVHAYIGPPISTISCCPLHILAPTSQNGVAHTEYNASEISPFQQSSRLHLPINCIDLHSAPTFPLEKPRKPRTQKPKSSPKRFPPLPSPVSSPPYVICQHCFQLLSLPLDCLDCIDQECSVVSLRCALCMRVSFFSTRQKQLLSSSNAAEREFISVSDPAQDGVTAELQSKKELKSMVDGDPLITSLEGTVSNVKANQCRVLEPDLFLIHQSTKEEDEHEQLDGAIDASTSALPSTMLPCMTAIYSPRGHCPEQRPLAEHIDTMEAQTPIIENFSKACAKNTDQDIPKNTCVKGTEVKPFVTAMDASIGECGPVEDDVEITETDMHVIDGLRSAFMNATVLRNPEVPLCSRPRLNPEFAGFSSVQDWMNSLEQESFCSCPTPLMSTGVGSDIHLREPLHWQNDDRPGNEMAVLPVPGSPLHEHFGYKSARELLNKTLSSDDEVKAHSDTNSSPSTSNASASTFKPPGFDNVGEPTLRTTSTQSAESHGENDRHPKKENQSSLANLLKRSFKGFGERKILSMSSGKLRVVVNGHALSEAALKRAEERAGKLRAGTYWYDSMAGFWGIVGGPCLGVLPPFIEELHYPMAGNCSNGDTKVFVNGRELHHRDLQLLSHRGLPKKPGKAYALSFDGIVIDQASGEELKQIGKLAPTVEKRGKGFGMYMEKPRRFG